MESVSGAGMYAVRDVGGMGDWIGGGIGDGEYRGVGGMGSVAGRLAGMHKEFEKKIKKNRNRVAASWTMEAWQRDGDGDGMNE